MGKVEKIAASLKKPAIALLEEQIREAEVKGINIENLKPNLVAIIQAIPQLEGKKSAISKWFNTIKNKQEKAKVNAETKEVQEKLEKIIREIPKIQEIAEKAAENLPARLEHEVIISEARVKAGIRKAEREKSALEYRIQVMENVATGYNKMWNEIDTVFSDVGSETDEIVSLLKGILEPIQKLFDELNQSTDLSKEDETFKGQLLDYLKPLYGAVGMIRNVHKRSEIRIKAVQANNQLADNMQKHKEDTKFYQAAGSLIEILFNVAATLPADQYEYFREEAIKQEPTFEIYFEQLEEKN